MTEGRPPFVHRVTEVLKDVLDRRVKAALEKNGIDEELQSLQEQEEELGRQLEEKKRQGESGGRQAKELEEKLKDVLERKEKLLKRRKRVEDELRKIQMNDGGEATEEIKPHTGGCYPGSASFVDLHGRLRRMDSLKIGDEVHVITTKGICLEPVITFIHYHPEVMQEFLKITFKKNKVLKITEDHLMFVEKRGQETAIPARNVNVGDTVYVRGKHGVEKDAVQSISSVYEKGVYVPVTLSGTFLVNNVHTSCYFDVLSHEWSHRAMGVARAVHYVSPLMLQWISGVGQKDGFPGWCRLAHKILTLLD